MITQEVQERSQEAPSAADNVMDLTTLDSDQSDTEGVSQGGSCGQWFRSKKGLAVGSFSEDVYLRVPGHLACVNVQLRGWDLHYTGGHVSADRISVRISPVDYDRRTGRATFNISGKFHDRFPDPFTWQVWFTVLGIA